MKGQRNEKKARRVQDLVCISFDFLKWLFYGRKAAIAFGKDIKNIDHESRVERRYSRDQMSSLVELHDFVHFVDAYNKYVVQNFFKTNWYF